MLDQRILITCDASLGGVGIIAGDEHTQPDGVDGLVTINGVPGVRQVEVRERAARRTVAVKMSRPDGTYRFIGLNPDLLFDVIARDHEGVFEDVIVGAVQPFLDLRVTNFASRAVVGVPYAHAYRVRGGEGPYTFSITGALPTGLAPAFVANGVDISGTVADVSAYTWTVRAIDARGTEAVLADAMQAYPPPPAGAERYWRIKVTYANSHCSIKEVELAESPAGPNICGAGEVIASGQWPGDLHKPANAFDGLTGDANTWAAETGMAGWLGYVFPSKVLLKEVRIFARTEYSQSPRDFTIEKSANGIDWTPCATYANQTSWPTAFVPYSC